MQNKYKSLLNLSQNSIRMKNLIVASTSTIYGSSFLEYLLEELREHFQGIQTLLFIPFARPGSISYDAYTDHVREGLEKLKLLDEKVHAMHEPFFNKLNKEELVTLKDLIIKLKAQ